MEVIYKKNTERACFLTFQIRDSRPETGEEVPGLLYATIQTLNLALAVTVWAENLFSLYFR